jgi:tetratricopeptide (TPR) repeat protein
MNMKYYFLTLSLLATAACNNAGKPSPDTTNTTAANHTTEKRETAIAHSLEKQTPPSGDTSGGKSKWTQSGDPIDTKEFDAAIASTQAAETKNPGESTKKALSEAYFKRADALTKARQYASALGDYRKSLKYDASNADAKNWIDQIIMIYDSLGREAPPEGQEPAPLPYKKGE